MPLFGSYLTIVIYNRKTFMVQTTGMSGKIRTLDILIMSWMFYLCATVAQAAIKLNRKH